MEEVKKKRGRPRKDSSRRHEVHLRLTDEELDLLRKGAKSCGENYSDFLRNSAVLRVNIMEKTKITADERIELSKYVTKHNEFDYYDGDDYYDYD